MDSFEGTIQSVTFFAIAKGMVQIDKPNIVIHNKRAVFVHDIILKNMDVEVSETMVFMTFLLRLELRSVAAQNTKDLYNQKNHQKVFIIFL